MKKIISVVIIIATLLSLTVLPVNAAVSEEEGIISLLRELEIMQGDENGDMMLDKKVSRAEFAKIAIAASPQKNSVAEGLRQSPFKDVPYTTWYAPYVKASVSAGYVMGYLDATFRPENTVTYEEAATILIRVLGYDDTAFGEAYPYGQLSKAQSLDVLDDVDASQGDELTRRQVMRMVYNALGALTSQNTPLLASHDTSLTEDADIIATENEDDSLGADKVFTSVGTFTKGDYFNDESAGMTGDIYIKNKKDIIAFVPDVQKKSEGYETYFVYSVLSNSTIVGYSGGRFEEIDIPEGATVYRNQQPTTYAAVKGSLEMGDTLYIKRTQNGSVDYVTYDTNNLEGPVKVTGDGWMASLGASYSSKVFRNGGLSSVSAVTTNDIAYYSKPLDVVFAYTDKVTGVYEKATPTKDSPTSVTVSGKEYKIESVEAFNDLSSSGTYKYGDTVTLLLGKDGEVAGIAGGGTTTNVSGAGFVTESGKKDFTNPDGTVYSSYYVNIVTADGTVNEYQTSSDYKSMVCGIVRVSFKNGKASLSRVNSMTGVNGKVNATSNTVGTTPLSDTVKILDTSGTYSDDFAVYTRVYPQRLDGVTLSSSNVMYYTKNGNGEIEELILKDVTGDTYTYGLVITRDKNTGAYTIDINGTQNVYATGLSSTATGPHKLTMRNGQVSAMQQLASYSGLITSLTNTEAEIGNQKYLLSDNVIIYHRVDAASYMKIPVEEATSANYRMTAYYDKPQSSGGRIRVIIAQDR